MAQSRSSLLHGQEEKNLGVFLSCFVCLLHINKSSSYSLQRPLLAVAGSAQRAMGWMQGASMQVPVSLEEWSRKQHTAGCSQQAQGHFEGPESRVRDEGLGISRWTPSLPGPHTLGAGSAVTGPESHRPRSQQRSPVLCLLLTWLYPRQMQLANHGPVCHKQCCL